MKNKKLEINATLQIQKPIDEVFEAIVDPAKMSNYFISKSTGRMEEGKILTWEFPEFERSFPVRISKIELNNFIAYYWEGPDGNDLLVEIKLEIREDHSTLVNIREKSMPVNDTGIEWLKSNSRGWANFLACLKAYLEYGINLRKGGFDYLIKTLEK
ncbi:MAG: SRPBCC domain-containing protein [Bacteroidales bacterium]|nr:SRPBCC domain-containing protein [Bacteroidales bacterium]MCF8404582.1 SRPBCC domain-containing protein [Bacteroidales bacterium]